MTIADKFERFLNFDRIDTHSARVRARAVYVMGRAGLPLHAKTIAPRHNFWPI